MNAVNDIHICLADYAVPDHALALVTVLDAYARDAMGGGQALSEYARLNVVNALAKLPQAFSVLAFEGSDFQKPVGLVNCMQGFSTFACKPLVNIHDLAVLSGYRGQRIAERMLEMVEAIARERGACKLTLEVLSGNSSAMRLYHRVGFAQYQLDPAAGKAEFLQKWLD